MELSVLGVGRGGRSLGRLWGRAGVFELRQVVARSEDSAAGAAEFIGFGRPAVMANLESAENFLLAVSDDSLELVAAELSRQTQAAPPKIVFHVSGAKSSEILRKYFPSSVSVASFHPAKSFADPARAVETFSGTLCAFEGEALAIRVLRPAFEAIGASCVAISATGKTAYHAGLVLGCSSLTALIHLSLQALESSGLSPDAAKKILQPLMQETLQNVFELGSAKALTGPIQRGDQALVADHLETLRSLSIDHVRVYQALGRVALEVAKLGVPFPKESLKSLENLLNEDDRGEARTHKQNSLSSPSR